MARSISTLLVLLFVGIALCPAPVHADGLNVVDAYNVNGVLAVPGNDACGGLTCVEALSFSFTLGIVEQSSNDGPEYWYYVLPEPIQIESVGPLAPFSLLPGEHVDCCADYLELHNRYQSEIDIVFQSGLNSTPVAPEVTTGDIFFCYDSVCRQDFPEPILDLGEAEATVTYAPEPSTLLLLGAGLFALGLLRLRQKRFPIVSTRNYR